MRKFLRFITALTVLSLVSGTPVMAESLYNRGSGSLGLDTVIDYERTPQTSHIIIDKEGYLPSAKKVFYIYGSNLGQNYQIVNMKSKEVVADSNMTMLETKDKDFNIYIGDFSTLTDEGVYRIYQDDVGYSDEFAVDSDVYIDMSDRVLKTISDYSFKNKEDMMFSIANIMLTKEIYPTSKTDDKFVRECVDSLLEKKDEYFVGDNAVSPEFASMMAGTLAQYYYVYKDEDLLYYNSVMALANSAYIYADMQKDAIPADVRYYAAANLYRITGYAKYLTAIAEYDDLSTSSKKLSTYNMTLLADMAYLKTDYRTDYARCEGIFTSYVDKASDISIKTDKAHFYVQPDIESLDDNAILDNMMILGICSYVLSSHEYASIQGNYLHYLFGLNKDKVNHLNEVKAAEAGTVSEDVTQLSKLIFVLGSNRTSENTITKE